MMNFSSRSLCLAVFGVGMAVGVASCSSQDAPATEMAQGSVVGVDSQDAPIAVGQDAVLSGVSSSSFRLLSEAKDAVAEVSLTERGLHVKGLGHGWTKVRLQELGASTKERSIDLYVSGERPQLPTEMFAPANVAEDGKGLALEAGAKSGYFTYEEAKDLRLSYGGKEYRVPTKTEVHALLPYVEQLEYGRSQFRSYIERVTLDGETKQYKETFYTPGHGVAYAVRFEKTGGKRAGEAQDNSRRTAFRYAYEQVNGVYRLQITARHLGEHFAGDINYVAQEGFWKSFPWDDKTIELQALGVRDPEGNISSYAALGEYWTVTPGEDDLSASALGFGTSSASSTIHADRSMARPVRLIQVK